MAHENPETSELAILFPENFPGSLAASRLREAEELAAEDDARLEGYVARNYGDCGASLHTEFGDNPYGTRPF